VTQPGPTAQRGSGSFRMVAAVSVAPSAASCESPNSMAGVNSTPTCMGSEEVSVVTVGSRLVSALMTPSGLVKAR
jgi:hypothetical protein